MDYLNDQNKARTSKTTKYYRKKETKWEDVDVTTFLCSLIASHSTSEFWESLETEHDYSPFLRSKDSRGPMFWA